MFKIKSSEWPLLVPAQSPYDEKLKQLWREHAPFFIFALKSAVAAALSWQIAYSLLGVEGGFPAPVTAVIIVQLTSAQTAKKSVERILGVLLGVTLSVLTAHIFGVNDVTVLLMVLAAQLIGLLLKKKGGSYAAVQVPISAMLGLIVAYGDTVYPTYRLLGAIIGGVIGTAISMLFSPPIYISRARDALAELATRMAELIPELSDAIAGISTTQERQDIYTRIQGIEKKVRSTEKALSLGFDNARLNPWARQARGYLTDYADVLAALSQITHQMRRVAFTINEPLIPWSAITRSQRWPAQYADLVRIIGNILGRTSSYMDSLAVQIGKSGFQGTHVSAYRKENILFSLAQAKQLLAECEQNLAREERNYKRNYKENAKADYYKEDYKERQPAGISNGYHVAIQGSVLIDLRRMLNELDIVIAKLPPVTKPESESSEEEEIAAEA